MLEHVGPVVSGGLLFDGCCRVRRAQDEWYDASGHSATLGAEVPQLCSQVEDSSCDRSLLPWR